MDLRQGSKASLLIQLATSHALVVGTDISLWTFSPPLALSGDADGFDTRIKLTAARGQPTYKQWRSFKYNRFNLTDVFRNSSTSPATPWSGTAPTSTYGCFAFIKKAYGILFDANDLQDVATVDNGDGTYKVTLTAKDTCILWQGTTTINTGKLPDINKAVSPANFDWSSS